MKNIIIAFVFIFHACSVCSQSKLNENLNQLRKIKPFSFLYLHHDKDIYTNNEKIWFSAYLLNTPNPIAEHKLLNVALVNEQTRKSAVSQKFVITDGLSSGFVLLPDSIPPGNYQLMAYSNVLNAQNLPIAQFRSSIKVFNISQPTFTSRITWLDTLIKNGAMRFQVNIDGLDANRKAVVSLNYQLGADFSKSIKIDRKQTTISIPEHLLKQNTTLLLNVNVDGEVQYHTKLIPTQEKQKLNVKFYPEGGALVADLQSRVGWEVTTADGRPLSLKGMLMKNNEALYEVSTNNYGLGSFVITPNDGAEYSVRLQPGVYASEGINIKLPAQSTDTDITLHIPKAVLNDSLRFIIASKQVKPIQMMLHNDSGDYVLLKGNTNASTNVNNISIEALQKGLNTITILDASGKPLAERLFFAHHNQQDLSQNIKIEKENYNIRDSVKLKLKLSDMEGKAASGIVSVSVVQNNRLSTKTANIEHYFYLNNSLNELPANPSGNGLQDKEYLENILLIKGWRRYTAVLQALNRDSVFMVKENIMSGAVFNGQKPLKKAVNLISFGSIKTGIIETNTDGSFNLRNDDIMVERNNNVFLRVGVDKNNYDFKIADALLPITNALVSKMKPTIFESLLNHQENSILKNLQNVIALKDVEITVKKGAMYGTKGEAGANECGDYVSVHHYLNYPGTPLSGRLKPIKNTPYLTRTDLQGSQFKVERVWYTGCLTENEKMGIAIAGINTGKEYYMAVEDDGGLQYHSTLYWQSGMVTNASGEIPISFKAGDIADDFSIIVQGISNKGLVNMKETFKISDKP
ncbi:hypothetical protein [Pedobacter sp. Leaf170]|uniref:hypothetical protein n=1 Tax=Pedobacter sp. Leaf170 TaxID=2876558 RepID=UPI001E61D768|nr:hypothetical protein [Pedobacter sp. Leaf170]